METAPVKTEAEYDAALQRIKTLMGARAGSPEGEELDALVALVEAYEAEHHPISPIGEKVSLSRRPDTD